MGDRFRSAVVKTYGKTSRDEVVLAAGPSDASPLGEGWAFPYDARNGTQSLAMAHCGGADPANSSGFEDPYTIPFTVSDSQEDRDGDIVFPDGCQTKNYARNPVWFFGHQAWEIPIGVATNKARSQLYVRPDATSIWAACRFDEHDPDAMFVHDKVKSGFLNATSIAFVPIEAYRRGANDYVTRGDGKGHPHHQPTAPSGWVFKSYDLTEISIVGVPSNANALRDILDREKSFISPKLAKGISRYATVPKPVFNGGVGKVEKARRPKEGDRAHVEGGRVTSENRGTIAGRHTVETGDGNTNEINEFQPDSNSGNWFLIDEDLKDEQGTPYGDQEKATREESRRYEDDAYKAEEHNLNQRTARMRQEMRDEEAAGVEPLTYLGYSLPNLPVDEEYEDEEKAGSGYDKPTPSSPQDDERRRRIATGQTRQRPKPPTTPLEKAVDEEGNHVPQDHYTHWISQRETPSSRVRPWPVTGDDADDVNRVSGALLSGDPDLVQSGERYTRLPDTSEPDQMTREMETLMDDPYADLGEGEEKDETDEIEYDADGDPIERSYEKPDFIARTNQNMPQEAIDGYEAGRQLMSGRGPEKQARRKSGYGQESNRGDTGINYDALSGLTPYDWQDVEDDGVVEPELEEDFEPLNDLWQGESNHYDNEEANAKRQLGIGEYIDPDLSYITEATTTFRPKRAPKKSLQADIESPDMNSRVPPTSSAGEGPFHMGMEAGRLGKSSASCPYHDDDARMAWAQGYVEGQGTVTKGCKKAEDDDGPTPPGVVRPPSSRYGSNQHGMVDDTEHEYDDPESIYLGLEYYPNDPQAAQEHADELNNLSGRSGNHRGGGTIDPKFEALHQQSRQGRIGGQKSVREKAEDDEDSIDLGATPVPNDDDSAIDLGEDALIYEHPIFDDDDTGDIENGKWNRKSLGESSGMSGGYLVDGEEKADEFEDHLGLTPEESSEWHVMDLEEIDDPDHKEKATELDNVLGHTPEESMALDEELEAMGPLTQHEMDQLLDDVEEMPYLDEDGNEVYDPIVEDHDGAKEKSVDSDFKPLRRSDEDDLGIEPYLDDLDPHYGPITDECDDCECEDMDEVEKAAPRPLTQQERDDMALELPEDDESGNVVLDTPRVRQSRRLDSAKRGLVTDPQELEEIQSQEYEKATKRKGAKGGVGEDVSDISDEAPVEMKPSARLIANLLAHGRSESDYLDSEIPKLDVNPGLIADLAKLRERFIDRRVEQILELLGRHHPDSDPEECLKNLLTDSQPGVQIGENHEVESGRVPELDEAPVDDGSSGMSMFDEGETPLGPPVDEYHEVDGYGDDRGELEREGIEGGDDLDLLEEMLGEEDLGDPYEVEPYGMSEGPVDDVDPTTREILDRYRKGYVSKADDEDEPRPTPTVRPPSNRYRVRTRTPEELMGMFGTGELYNEANEAPSHIYDSQYQSHYPTPMSTEEAEAHSSELNNLHGRAGDSLRGEEIDPKFEALHQQSRQGRIGGEKGADDEDSTPPATVRPPSNRYDVDMFEGPGEGEERYYVSDFHDHPSDFGLPPTTEDEAVQHRDELNNLHGRAGDQQSGEEIDPKFEALHQQSRQGRIGGQKSIETPDDDELDDQARRELDSVARDRAALTRRTTHEGSQSSVSRLTNDHLYDSQDERQRQALEGFKRRRGQTGGQKSMYLVLDKASKKPVRTQKGVPAFRDSKGAVQYAKALNERVKANRFAVVKTKRGSEETEDDPIDDGQGGTDAPGWHWQERSENHHLADHTNDYGLEDEPRSMYDSDASRGEGGRKKRRRKKSMYLIIDKSSGKTVRTKSGIPTFNDPNGAVRYAKGLNQRVKSNRFAVVRKSSILNPGDLKPFPVEWLRRAVKHVDHAGGEVMKTEKYLLAVSKDSSLPMNVRKSAVARANAMFSARKSLAKACMGLCNEGKVERDGGSGSELTDEGTAGNKGSMRDQGRVQADGGGRGTARLKAPATRTQVTRTKAPATAVTQKASAPARSEADMVVSKAVEERFNQFARRIGRLTGIGVDE